MSGDAETWTHARRVVMEDPKGMHGRPAALLMARLRSGAPGTRFGLAWGERLADFGEASKVSVFALLREGPEEGGELLALASGPGAGYVLDAAAEVFSRRQTPESDLADWRRVGEVLGDQREAMRLQREMPRTMWRAWFGTGAG